MMNAPNTRKMRTLRSTVSENGSESSKKTTNDISFKPDSIPYNNSCNIVYENSNTILPTDYSNKIIYKRRILHKKINDSLIQNFPNHREPFYNGNLIETKANGSLYSCNAYAERPPSASPLESSKKNGMILTSFSASNYIPEILLMANFICSLIFFNILRNDQKVSKKYVSEGLFSSFEQGLLFKMMWCTLFGLMVDSLSWKFAFRCQSVIWICFLISNSFKLNLFISQLLATACFSSSSLLITVIGIVKICEPKRCWVLLCHLNFISSLFLLFTQFQWNQFMPLRQIIVNYLETFFQDYNILHNIVFQTYMNSASLLMILGCVFCLMFIPSFYDKKIEDNTEAILGKSDCINISRLKCFIKILSLKLFIFLPASCYLVLNNGLVERSIPTLIVVCVSLWVLIPFCDRVIRLRRLLFCLTGLLNGFYVLLYFDRYLDLSQLMSVLIPSLLLVVRPLFEYYVIAELNEYPLERHMIGFTFASLLSTHFIIKYFSVYFVSFLK